MDAKVLYWTGALINLLAIVGLTARGVFQIRRGEVVKHRRSMLTAGSLVLAFLFSYVLKLLFLGRENLAVWSGFDRGMLRFHELCVFTMLIAGGLALNRAWRMRDTRNVTRSPEDEHAPAAVVKLHRRAGWSGVVGAVLGFLTAAVVLLGMYQRAA